MRCGCAESDRFGSLCLAAAGHHDLGAHRQRNGQCRTGDTGTDAHHEHCLSRRHPRATQHPVRREIRQRVGRTLRPRAVGRPQHHVARRRNSKRGVAAPTVLAIDHEAGTHRAVVAEGDDVLHRRHPRVDHHLVTHTNVVDSGADGIDNACHVAARHVRQRRARLASGHPEVHVVQCAGPDANAHVVICKGGWLDVTPAVRARQLVEDPGVHRTDRSPSPQSHTDDERIRLHAQPHPSGAAPVASVEVDGQRA